MENWYDITHDKVMELLERITKSPNSDLTYVNLQRLFSLEFPQKKQLIKNIDSLSLARFLFQLYLKFIFEVEQIYPPEYSKLKLSADELKYLAIHFDTFIKLYNTDLFLMRKFILSLDIGDSSSYDLKFLLMLARSTESEILRLLYDFILIYVVPGIYHEVNFMGAKDISKTDWHTLDILYGLLYKWSKVDRKSIDNNYLTQHINNLHEFFQSLFQNILDTNRNTEPSQESILSFEIIKAIFAQGSEEYLSFYLLQTIVNTPAEAYAFIIGLNHSAFATDDLIVRALKNVYASIFPLELDGTGDVLEHINTDISTESLGTVNGLFEFRFPLKGILTRCSIHKIDEDLWALSCMQDLSKNEIEYLIKKFPALKTGTFRLGLYFFKIVDDECQFYEFINGQLDMMSQDNEDALKKIVMFCIHSQNLQNEEDMRMSSTRKNNSKPRVNLQTQAKSQSDNPKHIPNPSRRWIKNSGLNEEIERAEESVFRDCVVSIHNTSHIKFIVDNCKVDSLSDDLVEIGSVNIVRYKSHTGTTRWYIEFLDMNNNIHSAKVSLHQEFITSANALDGWLELSGKKKTLRVYINFNTEELYLSSKDSQKLDFQTGPSKHRGFILSLDNSEG